MMERYGAFPEAPELFGKIGNGGVWSTVVCIGIILDEGLRDFTVCVQMNISSIPVDMVESLHDPCSVKKLHVVVGDFEGYLHFINQTTGDIVSRYEVDSSGLNIAPTVHDDIIYAQSRNGDLQAIKIP